MSDIVERMRKDAELQRLRAENERLRKRLEIDLCHPYDGIYCRDETIRGAARALCYQDKRIDTLTARVAELEGALKAWDDAVRIDVLVEGPRYMGVSSTLGRKAWEMTRAALEEKP